MQPDSLKRRSPREAGLSKGAAFGDGLHHDSTATAEPLLQRLDGVQKAGNGWRARCPACGGTSRKVSIAERDNRVLVHCFGCSDGDGVLAAVGLTWADLHPPRGWPQTPDERRAAQRSMRETAWAAALEVLPLEVSVIRLAAMHLANLEPLAVEDDERLALACARIEGAAFVLTDRPAWKPDDCYAPARLAQIKRNAVAELRRQVEAAEIEARAAEKQAQEVRP